MGLWRLFEPLKVVPAEKGSIRAHNNLPLGKEPIRSIADSLPGTSNVAIDWPETATRSDAVEGPSRIAGQGSCRLCLDDVRLLTRK